VGSLTDLFVVPHHFDRLRRPRTGSGTAVDAALEQALAWNVFRTFELLPPAFWLRRLRARLQDTNLGAPAPTLTRVSLWPVLTPSPAQALEDGGSPVVPDVLIETEFTVWTLLTLAGRDLEDDDEGSADPILRAIDASAWYAGGRTCCFGLIVSDVDRAPRAVARARHYARRRAHVLNRLAAGGAERRNLGAIGIARWRDLAEILEDCTVSDALAPAERAMASRTLDWFAQIEERLNGPRFSRSMEV
jgi:hypothetical protein